MKKGLQLLITLVLIFAFTTSSMAEAMLNAIENGQAVQTTYSLDVRDESLKPILDDLELSVAQKGDTEVKITMSKNGEAFLSVEELVEDSTLYMLANFLGEKGIAYTAAEYFQFLLSSLETQGMSEQELAVFNSMMGPMEQFMEEAFSGKPMDFNRLGELYLAMLGFEEGKLPEKMVTAWDKLLSNHETTSVLISSTTHDDAVKQTEYVFTKEAILSFAQSIMEATVENSLFKQLLGEQDMDMAEFSQAAAENLEDEWRSSIGLEKITLTFLYDEDDALTKAALKTQTPTNQAASINCDMLTIKNGKIYSGEALVISADGKVTPSFTYTFTVKPDMFQGTITSTEDSESCRIQGRITNTPISDGVVLEECTLTVETDSEGFSIISSLTADDTVKDAPIISGTVVFNTLAYGQAEEVFCLNVDMRTLPDFESLDKSKTVHFFTLPKDEQEAFMAGMQSDLETFIAQVEQLFSQSISVPGPTPQPVGQQIDETYTEKAIQVSFMPGELPGGDESLSTMLTDLCSSLALTIQVDQNATSINEYFALTSGGKTLVDLQGALQDGQLLMASNLFGDTPIALTAQEYVDLLGTLEIDLAADDKEKLVTMLDAFFRQDYSAFAASGPDLETYNDLFLQLASAFTEEAQGDLTCYKATFTSESLLAMIQAALDEATFKQMESLLEGDPGSMDIACYLKDDAFDHLELTIHSGEEWAKFNISGEETLFTTDGGDRVELTYAYTPYEDYRVFYILASLSENDKAPYFSGMAYAILTGEEADISFYYGSDAVDTYLGTLAIKQIPAKPLPLPDAADAIHIATLSQEELEAFYQNISTTSQTEFTKAILSLPASVLSYFINAQ